MTNYSLYPSKQQVKESFFRNYRRRECKTLLGELAKIPEKFTLRLKYETVIVAHVAHSPICIPTLELRMKPLNRRELHASGTFQLAAKSGSEEDMANMVSEFLRRLPLMVDACAELERQDPSICCAGISRAWSDGNGMRFHFGIGRQRFYGGDKVGYEYYIGGQDRLVSGNRNIEESVSLFAQAIGVHKGSPRNKDWDKSDYLEFLRINAPVELKLQNLPSHQTDDGSGVCILSALQNRQLNDVMINYKLTATELCVHELVVRPRFDETGTAKHYSESRRTLVYTAIELGCENLLKSATLLRPSIDVILGYSQSAAIGSFPIDELVD
jgi:hypothetical protein